jgi:hypothetical protein
MNSIFKRLIVCGLLLGAALGLQVSAQQIGAEGQKTGQQTGNDAVQLSMKGRKLSAAEAESLEQRLAANPSDLEARFILIGYYTTSREPVFKRKRAEQTFWVIENIPDSPQVDHLIGVLLNQHDEGFDKARKLWLKQLELHPGNTAVLSNAANFFLLSDKALAEKLLKAGAAAEPNEPRWHSRLGHLYMIQFNGANFVGTPPAVKRAAVFEEQPAPQVSTRRDVDDSNRSPIPDEAKREQQRLARLAKEQNELTQEGQRERHQNTGKAHREFAELAYLEFELAYKLTLDDAWRRPLVTDLAKSAFEAGKLEQARQWATVLVNQSERDWNYGNAVHFGHLILGQLALLGGNLEGAKEELIAAGKTPGSPQLNSFGPNMQLAKQLLEKGERQSVLDYFDLCAKFWQFPARLPEWTATVKGGGIPNFGANLNY